MMDISVLVYIHGWLESGSYIFGSSQVVIWYYIDRSPRLFRMNKLRFVYSYVKKKKKKKKKKKGHTIL